MPNPTPTELEARRALRIAKLIVDAHDDHQPIPVVRGIDAVNLALVLLALEPLARRPPSSGGGFSFQGTPRAPVAGEVLPPERRATPWKKPIEGIDK